MLIDDSDRTSCVLVNIYVHVYTEKCQREHWSEIYALGSKQK